MEFRQPCAVAEVPQPDAQRAGNIHFLTEERFVAMDEVERLCLMKKSWIYEAQATGKFPRSYRLSGNRVAWKLSEVSAWIADRPRSNEVKA